VKAKNGFSGSILIAVGKKMLAIRKTAHTTGASIFFIIFFIGYYASLVYSFYG
jgi:hypothetical protein